MGLVIFAREIVGRRGIEKERVGSCCFSRWRN